MAETIDFNHNSDGLWEAEIASSGSPMAVEVNRTERRPFIVKGSIENLSQVTLRDFGPRADANLLFEIDVPEGVNLHFISYSEVVGAKAEGL